MQNDPQHTQHAILIVEDEEVLSTQLRWALSSEYRVFTSTNAEEALTAFIKHQPSAVILDLGLPPFPTDTHEGFRVLGELLRIDPMAKVIILTGNIEKENALKAVQSGAYDYCTKPVNAEELRVILKRAIHLRTLEQQNTELTRKAQWGPQFLEIVGTCESMKAVFRSIERVATTDATVLITGESGTGKELVAQAIHAKSLRRDGPFIAINCGAIPENLLESELFGHEKGAFTGAHIQREGKLELAENGTLFLDEISELSLNLQVKLLRVLQEREIERVGGRKPIPLNTRFIAASNKDLHKAVEQETFREDLYYRLAVVSIAIPPLRERVGDILLLARVFLVRFCKEHRKRVKVFSPDTLDAMEQYHWPGNVRELENKIQRAVIMSEGKVILPEHLELAVFPSLKETSLQEAREEMERRLLEKALARHQGNITRVASELKISRPTLHDLLKKLRLDARDYR